MTSFATTGPHSITAVYSGDTNFNSSTSAPFSQTINQGTTTTTVTSPVSSSTFSESVTLTATVAVTAPGTGTPTGSVQFKDNGSNLGSVVPLVGGVGAQVLHAVHRRALHCRGLRR